MPTSAGPNSKGENSLVFAIDTADTRNSYKGQPVTNIWESGDPNGHGSILRKINTDKWLGKVIESGVVYHNIVNRRATTDSPDKTFFNNGGLNMGSMNFRTLNPATKYIQISFDYYGVEPYQRYCCPHLGLNGYLGISYTDGTTNTSGWDTTYSPGTSDDWNNLEENMGKWQRISLIATVDPNREPQGIWALYIYYDSLMGGEGYFANLMFSEHSSYPTGPVRFTSFERDVEETLLDITKNNIINVTGATYDSNEKIAYDGTDTFIQTDYLSNIVGLTPQGISFELVVKAEDLSTYSGMLGDYVGPSGTGFAIKKASLTDDRFEFRTYAASAIPRSVSVIEVGRYYHVVCTWANTGMIQIFIDGVLETVEPAASKTWNHGNGLLRIGDCYNSMGFPAEFNGEIPVVKIYNKALSAEEVTANFEVIRKRFNI
jgi:hypothetical protein